MAQRSPHLFILLRPPQPSHTFVSPEWRHVLGNCWKSDVKALIHMIASHVLEISSVNASALLQLIIFLEIRLRIVA